MKSYTDLEQSKKLAKILPLESADFVWLIGHLHTDGPRYELIRTKNEVSKPENYWPCWSLAALLDVLKCFEPYIMFLQRTTDGHGMHLANVWRLSVESLDVDITLRDIYADNPVDACYDMILKLNELNLL